MPRGAAVQNVSELSKTRHVYFAFFAPYRGE
jgi:hypothetical protein